MARGRKRKQKELLNKLKSIAQSNNTDIGNFDFGPGFVVGLSSAKNYILFYKKKSDGSQKIKRRNGKDIEGLPYFC